MRLVALAWANARVPSRRTMTYVMTASADTEYYRPNRRSVRCSTTHVPHGHMSVADTGQNNAAQQQYTDSWGQWTSSKPPTYRELEQASLLRGESYKGLAPPVSTGQCTCHCRRCCVCSNPLWCYTEKAPTHPGVLRHLPLAEKAS